LSLPSRELEFEEYSPQLRGLRPRLRPDADIVPQKFRGETFFVLHDPVTLQYYRVRTTEREVLDQLDGETTLGEIHDRLKARFRGDAPSFRELVQFVFMLRQANLTVPEESQESRWDVERASKKRKRQLTQKLSSFMYLTIPLIDPERFLNAMAPYVRWVFSKPFFVVWLLTIGSALFAFFYNLSSFVEPANGVLAPGNLAYLYAAFVLIKACHEFGHAFSAKVHGAEVHRMGVMFLIFMPVPYVDVTPVWGFTQKWRRVLVGCAGMMVELFIASIAVFGWLALDPGVIRTVLYNMIFVASVSSLLFNGNPLLRYDAYYILSDWIEIPSLRQRSWEYIAYLLKKRVVGQKLPPSEATPRERAWFVVYGILSTIYRTFVVTGIILYIASKLFFVGLAMATVVATLWIVAPTVKLVKYVFFDAGTRAVRGRAVGVFAAAVAALVLALGALPVSYSVRAPCVLEPDEMNVVRAEWRGFVTAALVGDGDQVTEGKALARATNEELDFQVRRYECLIQGALSRLRMLEATDVAAAQALRSHLATLRKDLGMLRDRAASLTFRAPCDGKVIAPTIHRIEGRFLDVGDPLCTIASLDKLRISAVVETQDIADVRNAPTKAVRINFRSAPGRIYKGTIERIHPSATHTAPAASLTNAGGGPVILDPKSSQTPRTLLPWYRVDVELNPGQEVPPVGVSGTARFVAGRMPLGKQAWRAFRRMLHRRFLI